MNTQRMPVNTFAALDMQTILKKKKRSYEDLIYVFFFVFRLRVN